MKQANACTHWAHPLVEEGENESGKVHGKPDDTQGLYERRREQIANGHVSLTQGSGKVSEMGIHGDGSESRSPAWTGWS